MELCPASCFLTGWFFMCSKYCKKYVFNSLIVLHLSVYTLLCFSILYRWSTTHLEARQKGYTSTILLSAWCCWQEDVMRKKPNVNVHLWLRICLYIFFKSCLVYINHFCTIKPEVCKRLAFLHRTYIFHCVRFPVGVPQCLLKIAA